MDFDKAFERVIGHEGGYVNDPRDPGGETKFGISKRAYPYADIKNLTLNDAKAIYRKDYWNRCHIDDLPDSVRFDMFDTAVNSGVATAIKMMQRAVGVKPDGVWGPNTTAAVQRVSEYDLDKKFSGYRLMYLTDLPVWPSFSKGWVRRVASNLIED